MNTKITALFSAANLFLFGLLTSAPAQGTTITVTTLDDGFVTGQCTLRAAITAANSNGTVNACVAGDPGPDVIQFASGLTGTIALQVQATNTTLMIDEPLQINGPAGSPGITIEGTGIARLFQINSGAATTMRRLRMTGGRVTSFPAPGGTIYSQSDLSLIEVEIDDSATPGPDSPGGAIAVVGANLTLSHSTVSDSRTTGDDSPGGAIYVNSGDLELSDSHIVDNWTAGAAGGATTIPSHGGGIFVWDGDLSLLNSTVSGNQTLGSSTIGSSVGGGGIYHGFGSLSIVNSEIADNSVLGSNGFSGGVTTSGGFGHTSEVIASTIHGNSPGGVSFGNIWDTARVVNSTVSGNMRVGVTAGAQPSAPSPSLSLQHATISDNFAGSGSVSAIATSGAITLVAANSIISNAAPGGSDLCNITMHPTQSTHNLATDSSCGTNGLIGGAPVTAGALDLAPLGDYGGPTPTRALGPSSNAVNAAHNPLCTPLGVDQRGQPRPGSGSAVCDVGAFELQHIAQLDINPTTADFGTLCLNDVAPPETVTFASNGTIAIDVTAISPHPPPAPFSQFPSGCGMPPFNIPAGGHCTVQYGFFPGSPGLYVENLDVSSNDPNSPHTLTLQGVAEHAVLQDLADIDFGPVPVGSSANAPLLVANTGNCPFEVHQPDVLGPLPPEFDIQQGSCNAFPFSLGPNEFCALEVVFTPSAPGPVAHSNELGHTASTGSGAYMLSGEGLGASGQLTLSPIPADFGQWCLNELAPPQTVTFMNTGTTLLTVTSIDTPSPPPFGQLPGGCTTPPFSLGPGDSCTRDYNFLPFSSGTFSAALDVVSSDLTSPHQILLQGEALDAVLQDVTDIDFGAVDIGDTATASLTVANSGANCNFEVFMADALGPLPAEFDIATGTCPSFPFMLGPGNTCNLEVSFTPAAPGAVIHANALGTDASAGSADYTLQGVGADPNSAQLHVAPAALDFGMVEVNEATGPHTVTLHSVGGQSLDIFGVSAPGAPFSDVGGSCAGVTLSQGQSCELQYTFAPTATGTFTETLTVDSNDTANPQQDFELHGIGVFDALFDDRFEAP